MTVLVVLLIFPCFSRGSARMSRLVWIIYISIFAITMLLCHRPRLCTGSIPSTDQNLIVGSARVARLGVIKKIRILYHSLSTKDTVCRILLCRALRKTIFCELCYDCATPIFKNVLLQASEIWQRQRCHCPLLFLSLIELLRRWNCKTCIQPRKTSSKEPAAWSRFTDVQTSF